ncbi:LOW QUALITY PROTEIN: uncharacterized protein QC763_512065 [Podospora pseudopauciseta]|uniref:Uncharacterized protein n=1 Tax=Podospora pseudopauciseta TaxID=2093780 RepID=A0ABR0H9N2_9PEZI|nr:LOW QUALITY PROTEIN: hypothetical protein QC763_512065 [Podospora pseudopauciseta]
MAPMSFKDSIARVAGCHLRITLAWRYGGQDIGHLFERMKWALEEHKERFDKHFPCADLGTEEAEEMLEFLATWELDIEKMETPGFLTSLMHIFNEDLEPKYQLKDFKSDFISPGGVWKTIETLWPIIDRGMPAESPKNEPELPKLPERPPPLLVTCNSCGGKKLFGTGRLALKKHRGIGRLRRQRQRNE